MSSENIVNSAGAYEGTVSVAGNPFLNGSFPESSYGHGGHDEQLRRYATCKLGCVVILVHSTCWAIIVWSLKLYLGET